MPFFLTHDTLVAHYISSCFIPGVYDLNLKNVRFVFLVLDCVFRKSCGKNIKFVLSAEGTMCCQVHKSKEKMYKL